MTELRPAPNSARPTEDRSRHGASASPGRRWSRRWPLVAEAASATWLPWLVARVLVLGALGLAKYEVDKLHLTNAGAVLQAHLGLLGSDAGWYQSIAAHGYEAISRSALRFFPLMPLLAAGVHAVTRVSVGVALLILANASAFGATMVVYVLTKRELGTSAARASAWLLSLAPASFVFVMGYAEALFVLLMAASVLAWRRGTWWWAAAFSLLAGATRPVGCLLALPALVEAARTWRRASPPSRAGRVAAVLAAPGGCLAYLLWVGSVFGDALLPLRVQEQAGHHGAFTDPVVTLYRDGINLLHGHHVGSDVHLPWVLVAVALLVVCARTLPASYTVLAAALLAAALSGTNLDSFERYALSAFPLVMAATVLLRSRRVELAVLVLSAAAMVGYAVLAFQGAYVP